MKKKYLLLILLSSLYYSQTVEERKKIAEQSNKEGNRQLLQVLKENENLRKIRISDYLSKNPTINKAIKFGEFGYKEIMDVTPDGSPIYMTTYNEGAAITARANRLYSGGSLGLNIQGQGMTVGVWDGGSVRSTHQEFMVGGISKVALMDGSAISNHGTHVGGTIAAQGINPAVRGLAFNALLKSYDWTNDLGEMLGEVLDGMVVSNHSYGPDLTNINQLWVLGAYGSDSRLIDELCYNNPFYLPVFAAGNSRNDVTVPYSSQLATKFGYDMIGGKATAKNVLTVAAVQQVDNYTGPGDVLMSTFSSYGPTDDGRIKPEISMKGVNVLSSTSTSDTSVGFNSGTSMAAPGVTGVVALLQQYHNQLYSSYMKAATVKGLIMHTADEAGSTDGPDYEFGWGLINAENAAKAIRDKNLETSKSIIQENVLSNGGTFTKQISSNGTQPLRISISWTDPQYAGQNSGTVDPPTKYLVNDLDIKVTSASGTIYYPWKLYGLSGLFTPPTNNSTNDVDNFERVDIPLPSGVYTITVTHKGVLTGGSQNFSLIATGGDIATLSTNNTSIKETEVDIYPNPASDWLYFKNNNNQEANIIVLDMAGRLVKKDVAKMGKISVKDLSKGQYMLLYKDKRNIEKSFKFIKL
ncbi:S8 family serine peptidase [uncultured Chryseobacterium sp.]|jgi:Subtilisin-like serine proteases|uniref:S8 family serine peptidase n=1 Tax=uncultured Chryseobacterium sp. TaxID=259322 RepID=UPI00262C09BE|nr:S8 family serine peptidase [uncultured Chryseobacterium sp.]